MDNKEIYDKFNEIDFDVSAFEEVSMDEIEKQRLKKSLREKLSSLEENNIKDTFTREDKNVKSKKFIKKYRIAAAVAIIAILVGISPLGQEVIAQIAEKLIFTPSQGIIKEKEEKELYMLEEPLRVTIDNDSVLIKSIINDGENINVEMWFDEGEERNTDHQREIINNLKLKPVNEDIHDIDSATIDVGLTSFASGGYAGFSFEQKDRLITDFKLYYKDKEIGEFHLKKMDFKNGYDEVGGNAIDKDIRIGATSYYQEGERYFKLWSDKEHEEFEEYTVNLESIGKVEVKDEEGNILPIESAQDGTGRAFKVLSDYKGKLYIKIKDIELGYRLKEGTEIAIKIPKNGETKEINQELELKGLKDRIKVSTITNKDGEYTIHFDSSNNYDENRIIFMVRQDFRTGGGMGDVENKQGEVYLDNEDLSMKERFLRKIYFSIDNISVHQEGNWEFAVE
ncbi:hypothetical protein [Clostridium sp.]|uniref:hypothetical protein n=1 Tax=Clostridium sp. TaxID=1506 RepID=UPI0034648C5C